MTNKEKYKQAFSVLHPSEPISLEVEQMVKIQKKHKFQIAAAILAACILVGGSGTVYAANVGGIQRTIQLWIHGDQTDATLNVNEDGSYTLNYSDKDGKKQNRAEAELHLMQTETSDLLPKMKSWMNLICPMLNMKTTEAYGFIMKIRNSKLQINSIKIMSATSKLKEKTKPYI